MPQSSKSRIREVLKRAGSSPESIQKLIQHPEAFAKESGLSVSETASLKGADLVIAVSRNPLAGLGGNMQTTSPITITVTTHRGHFVSGDPPDLNKLDKVELVNVLRQALSSSAYSEHLRKTLNIKG